MEGLDRLAKFVRDRDGTQSDFARAVGVSKSYLSLILAGKRGPSLRVAAAIEKETGGEVPAASLLRVPEPAEARA